MRAHFVFMSITVTLLSLSACQNAREQKVIARAPDTIPVRVLALQSMDTLGKFEATGTFTSEEERVLSFKQGGAIAQMTVEAGDRFRKGQLLARLENDEVEVLMRQAQLVLEKAERDLARAQKLFADSVATKEQLENAQTAKDLAQQDVDRVKNRVEWNVLLAPYDGYVLQGLMRAGQVVGPGTPVLVISNAQPAHWMVKVGVSEKVWAQVRVGDAAVISTDAMQNQSMEGVVAKKSEGVDPSSGQMTLFVRLIQAPASSVAVGMFARVLLQKSTKEQGWLVPYEALLDGDQGRAYVFVTDDQKTAHKVQVQIGQMYNQEVMVTQGLEEAKYVIVSGSPYLKEGSLISVKP